MDAKTRVPRGVSTGGQFVERERDEATISLSPMSSGAPSAPRKSTDVITPRDAIALAARFAAAQAGKYLITGRADLEDIAQSALLSVWNSAHRGKVDGLTGGLISNAVGHAVTRAVMERTGVTRHEDGQARTKLRKQLDDFVHANSREPTETEVDRMAEKIRDTWSDPRHKPRVGFHQGAAPQSLEDPETAKEAAVIPAPVEPERDSIEDLANQMDFGLADKKRARLRLWNAIARTEGLPPVKRTGKHRTARVMRKAIDAVGGLDYVVQQYRRTGQLTPTAEAMFEPFDVFDEHSRRLVADYFASRRPLAEKLWEAAADSARNPGIY